MSVIYLSPGSHPEGADKAQPSMYVCIIWAIRKPLIKIFCKVIKMMATLFRPCILKLLCNQVSKLLYWHFFCKPQLRTVQGFFSSSFPLTEVRQVRFSGKLVLPHRIFQFWFTVLDVTPGENKQAPSQLEPALCHMIWAVSCTQLLLAESPHHICAPTQFFPCPLVLSPWRRRKAEFLFFPRLQGSTQLGIATELPVKSCTRATHFFNQHLSACVQPCSALWRAVWGVSRSSCCLGEATQPQAGKCHFWREISQLGTNCLLQKYRELQSVTWATVPKAET